MTARYRLSRHLAAEIAKAMNVLSDGQFRSQQLDLANATLVIGCDPLGVSFLAPDGLALKIDDAKGGLAHWSAVLCAWEESLSCAECGASWWASTPSKCTCDGGG